MEHEQEEDICRSRDKVKNVLLALVSIGRVLQRVVCIILFFVPIYGFPDDAKPSLNREEEDNLLKELEIPRELVSEIESSKFEDGSTFAYIYGIPEKSAYPLCKSWYMYYQNQKENRNTIFKTGIYKSTEYLVWILTENNKNSCDDLDRNDAIELSHPIEEKTLLYFHDNRIAIVKAAIEKMKLESPSQMYTMKYIDQFTNKLENMTISSIDVRNYMSTWVSNINYVFGKCSGISVYLETTPDGNFKIVSAGRITC